MTDQPGRMFDRFEIQDLQYRYTDALDRFDWVALRTVFTEQAILDYTMSDVPKGSSAEVVEWMSSAVPATFSKIVHYVTNCHVAIDGDDASANVPFYALAGLRNGRRMIFAGFYHDTYRRTPNGWRISDRAEEVVFTEGPYEPRVDTELSHPFPPDGGKTPRGA